MTTTAESIALEVIEARIVEHAGLAETKEAPAERALYQALAFELGVVAGRIRLAIGGGEEPTP
jgi:hypothetical protein